MTKFSNLSSGYVGEHADNLTLNSEFWARTNSKLFSSNNLLHLPQRVPRPGFFRELFGLENIRLQQTFRKRIETLNRTRRKLIQFEQLRAEEAHQLLNIERSLIRLGSFRALATAAPLRIQDPDLQTKLELVRESAILYLALSAGKRLDLKNLIKVWTRSQKLSIESQIESAIRLIVYSTRYASPGIDSKVTQSLRSSLQKYIPTTSYQLSLQAMGYRALPMGKDLSHAEKIESLLQMHSALNSFSPKDRIEKLLWDELKFTSLQTMSKWESSQGNLEAAEQLLKDMIGIDGNDSTAYSELGLLQHSLNRFADAKKSFERALKLGPPAMAMNAYFLGDCEFKLGKKIRSIKSFELSMRYDASALSPVLTLIKLYPKNRAKKLAKQVLLNRSLNSQLEKDERQELKARSK